MIMAETPGGYVLRGELTVDTVNPLFRVAPDFKGRECFLDLAEVGNTDSAGLALLVHWAQEAKKRGCSLQLRNASEQMLTMVRIHGLLDLFSLRSRAGSMAD